MMSVYERSGYSGREAADLVGITYRQLDYWARTDLVRPSISTASGSGSRRRYGYRDLLELKMVKTLLDNGQRLERVRAVFEFLRDMGDEVCTSQFLFAGSSVVLIRQGEPLAPVVKKYAGQGVLSLVSMAGIAEQLDADIRQMSDFPFVPDSPRCAP